MHLIAPPPQTSLHNHYSILSPLLKTSFASTSTLLPFPFVSPFVCVPAPPAGEEESERIRSITFPNLSSASCAISVFDRISSVGRGKGQGGRRKREE